MVCGLFAVWSGLLTSGEKADWLWLQLKPFGIKKLDQTGLSNTSPVPQPNLLNPLPSESL